MTWEKCQVTVILDAWNLFVLYFWAEKPSKTRPFPIKTRVIWAPGGYIITHSASG